MANTRALRKPQAARRKPAPTPSTPAVPAPPREPSAEERCRQFVRELTAPNERRVQQRAVLEPERDARDEHDELEAELDPAELPTDPPPPVEPSTSTENHG